ncbi:MAG: hypothetical protein J0L85_09040 [Zoogloea sp.]|nr:hypothetical protein [Zoogloea sp.]MCA0185076.1 hypothetical protein [Pseudomonadota bacterium]
MTHKLVVAIKGREAIPVRALCFADDLKRLSPDLVAQAAAGEDHYEGTWRLPTYHLSEGIVTELKASHWAYCCRRLKSISSRLKSTWGDADSWDLWRSEATPVLPAGVFVWLDEFREWYERTRPWTVKKNHRLLAHLEGDEQHDHVAVNEVLESIVRPWDVIDDDLSLVQLMLSEGDYSMAMEGFPLASTQPVTPTPENSFRAVADREELARLRAEAELVPTETHQAEAGVSTDGLVAWQRALLESWPQIRKAYAGKPSPRKAMQWLKKNGPRDIIPEHQPDIESMQWVAASDGAVRPVRLKTIQNTISVWKTAGKLPA